MILINFDIGSSQWHHDGYFDTRDEAFKYLQEEGFVFINGFYEKDYGGWFPKTRAFVNAVKPYKKKQ